MENAVPKQKKEEKKVVQKTGHGDAPKPNKNKTAPLEQQVMVDTGHGDAPK